MNLVLYGVIYMSALLQATWGGTYYDTTQYEICKKRGHLAEQEWVVNAPRVNVKDPELLPESAPGYRKELGEWHICRFCHKQFRSYTVVTLEEKP